MPFFVFIIKTKNGIIDAAYVTDRVAWSVGLSVGLSHSEPCKKKQLKRSRCHLGHLRWGLGWTQGTAPIRYSRAVRATVLWAFHTI